MAVVVIHVRAAHFLYKHMFLKSTDGLCVIPGQHDPQMTTTIDVTASHTQNQQLFLVIKCYCVFYLPSNELIEM